MIISDLLEETFLALSSNKVRSGLTTLGIIIGMSSVIAMVSIGQGSQASPKPSLSASSCPTLTARGQLSGGVPSLQMPS